MRSFYTIFILSLSILVSAQEPGWQWAKSAAGTVSETGLAVAKDEKGNTIVTGQYESSLISFGSYTLFNIGQTGTTDIFVVKYDSAGNVTWAKTFGGFSNEAGSDIAVDKEGNIYITGYFKSYNLLFGSFALVNTGTEDVFIVKISPVGTVKWAVNGGGTGWDRGSGIAVDGEKNIFVTGYFNSSTIYFDTVQATNSYNYYNDIFLVKLDSLGFPQWIRKASGTPSKHDKALGITFLADGKIGITGYFESTSLTISTFILTNKGLADVFIAWYDTAGNCLKAVSCGGDSTDWGISVAMDESGNTILTGTFNSTYLKAGSDSVAKTGLKDIFMIRYSADGSQQWIKSTGGTHNDEVKGIAVDGEKNILMTGYFFSQSIPFGTTVLANNGGADIFIAKYDSAGNVLWAESFGDDNDDRSNDIAVSSIGRIGICGGFASAELNMDAVQVINSGEEDVFTAELTAAGQSRWANSAKGNADNDGGISTATDESGNVIVAGFFLSPVLTFNETVLVNKGSSDIFLAKYDSSGNVIWSRKAGGKYADEIKKIDVDMQGNIVLTGYFESDSLFFDSEYLVSTDIGYSDMFIAKYDANGNIIWANKAGGTSLDIANGIAVSQSGNIYITGTFWSNTLQFDSITISREGTANDAFVAKYDQAGNALWASRIGGDSYDEGMDIVSDNNDDAIITGYFTSDYMVTGSDSLFNAGKKDVFIIKVSSSGTPLWSIAQGGVDDDEGKSLVTGQDGNIFLTGTYKSPSLTVGPNTLYLDNKNDIFLSNIDAGGNILWAKSINGSDDEFSTDLAADDSGSVYITGYFKGPQLKLGANYIMNNAASTYDFFIAKYDSSGNIIWVKPAGGALNDLCMGIDVGNNGDVFITGYFRSSSLAFGNTSLYATGNYDFFIAEMGYQTIGINEHHDYAEISMKVFPNPSNEYALISYDLPHRSVVHLEIFTATDEKIESLIHSEIRSAGKYVYYYRPPVSQIYFINLRVVEVENNRSVVVSTKKLIHLK